MALLVSDWYGQIGRDYTDPFAGHEHFHKHSAAAMSKQGRREWSQMLDGHRVGQVHFDYWRRVHLVNP